MKPQSARTVVRQLIMLCFFLLGLRATGFAEHYPTRIPTSVATPRGPLVYPTPYRRQIQPQPTLRIVYPTPSRRQWKFPHQGLPEVTYPNQWDEGQYAEQLYFGVHPYQQSAEPITIYPQGMSRQSRPRSSATSLGCTDTGECVTDFEYDQPKTPTAPAYRYSEYGKLELAVPPANDSYDPQVIPSPPTPKPEASREKSANDP